MADERGRYDVPLWPCLTLLAIAQPYADHPDFDPSWRVEENRE